MVSIERFYVWKLSNIVIVKSSHYKHSIWCLPVLYLLKTANYFLVDDLTEAFL